MPLSAKFRFIRQTRLARSGGAVQLPGQVRSQVQLGNEEKGRRRPETRPYFSLVAGSKGHALTLDSESDEQYSSVRMPSVTEAETQSTLLEVVRTLPSESQRAVLSYALFLHHQEETRRMAADEMEWDRHFSQPDKMAKFAEWARQSLDQHPPEQFDESRL